MCRACGGWGGGYAGDDSAKNQPLRSLKQQCCDADDAKSNANCICITHNHTQGIQYNVTGDIYKTYKDYFHRVEKEKLCSSELH